MNIRNSLDPSREMERKTQEASGAYGKGQREKPSRINKSWEVSDIEADVYVNEEEEEKKERSHRRGKLILSSAILLASVYMVFLIYGVFMTSFQYADNGALVMPVIHTVQELRKRGNYSEVLSLYLKMRDLYEEVLVLDYRVAAGMQEKAVLSTEYTRLDSEKVTALYTAISAASVSSDYLQMQNIMYVWAHDTLGDYLKNMAEAISSNSEEIAGEALSNREVLESDFRKITENVILIGESIPSVSLKELREWSPDGFVEASIEGLGLN